MNSILLSSKITGGYTTRESTFVVYLKVDGFQKCGGVLITDLYALTAGQCVSGISTERLIIGLGIFCITHNYRPVGKEHGVEKKFMHPEFHEFRTKNYLYDIAVLQVCYFILSIEILQIESTSHRPLCKWQRQSGNSVRANERDDGRFFLSLSTRTALERETA